MSNLNRLGRCGLPRVTPDFVYEEGDEDDTEEDRDGDDSRKPVGQRSFYLI